MVGTKFESLESEIVQSQRSDSKKDTVLKYTDAFYAEFADKLIQKKKYLRQCRVLRNLYVKCQRKQSVFSIN